jgi:RNA polymerase sigma-70 factor (ECF subfamily)
MHLSFGDSNPLASDLPDVWDRLIAAVGPASILVTIDARLGDALRGRVTAEDVWQETLLHAWRDRARCEWRGLASFRRWLLQVAENRIRDLRDALAADKRGAGRVELSLECDRDGPCRGSDYAGPVRTTTPSRAAIDRERAAAMAEALAALPDELRDVVQLRLFEDLDTAEIAARLQLGVSAVQHRFRKGVLLYYRRLRALLSGPTSADA